MWGNARQDPAELVTCRQRKPFLVISRRRFGTEVSWTGGWGVMRGNAVTAYLSGPGARRAIGLPSRRSSSITKSAVPSGRPIPSAFLNEVNASS
jgi:hypothetical protein